MVALIQVHLFLFQIDCFLKFYQFPENPLTERILATMNAIAEDGIYTIPSSANRRSAHRYFQD